MYVLFKIELTVLFCQCLFRGLRKSGSADEENEDKNKQELEKNINNECYLFLFLFWFGIKFAKAVPGRRKSLKSIWGR